MSLSPRNLHPHSLFAIHTRAPEGLIEVDGVEYASVLDLLATAIIFLNYIIFNSLHFIYHISILNCAVSFLFLSSYIKV
jgi:hypothetical protein